MSSESELEQKIQDKGLTAPRLTPGDIDNLVANKQFHVFDGSQLTVCCITLQNGYTVTGTSACASPENFNKEVGEDIAFENARDEIWAVAGYALKESLYRESLNVD